MMWGWPQFEAKADAGSPLMTAVFVLSALTIIGYVMNVIKIANIADFGHLNGIVVLRLVGLFLAPVGAFMGIFFW